MPAAIAEQYAKPCKSPDVQEDGEDEEERMGRRSGVPRRRGGGLSDGGRGRNGEGWVFTTL